MQQEGTTGMWLQLPTPPGEPTGGAQGGSSYAVYTVKCTVLWEETHKCAGFVGHGEQLRLTGLKAHPDLICLLNMGEKTLRQEDREFKVSLGYTVSS